MPTTTNFGWTTPADTDLVKDGASAMRTLGNGIDTSLVYLKGGTTGQILSKTSNTDLAFTWINNDQGDITAVTAGTGISGGGTSGAVTITNSMATEITAAGDIIVGTGSSTFDNLPIGSTGQILTADTTVSPYKVKWASASGSVYFAARINTNQSINSGTFTKVTFDTELFDSGSCYDPTTNYRFTVPTGEGGRYMIGFDVAWGVYSVGHQMIFSIYKNGSAIENSSLQWRDAGTDVQGGVYSKLVNLAAGDYIEAYVQQNSGAARTLYSPNANFWGFKI